jgi:hypothetical protein
MSDKVKSYINARLKRLVKSEANRIIKYATAEEKSRLTHIGMDGNNTEKCPYAQLTGEFHSNRANELLQKCGKPYSSMIYKYIKLDILDGNFTAIEFYTGQPDAKNKNLVNYIKGKTTNLEL